MYLNQQSDNIASLAEALAKAQGAMEPAVFNKTVTFSGRSYRYADLASVIEAVRKPLAANGLAIVQGTEIRDNGMVLVTKLLHASGQWVASEYPLPIAARPQELGAAMTYAKRYSITSLICIAADEDDDAESAQTAGQKASVPASKIKPQTVKAPENPHVIAEPDDAKWVSLFAAAIRAAKSAAEINEWQTVEATRLDKIEIERPKTYTRIMTGIEDARQELLARVD